MNKLIAILCSIILGYGFGCLSPAAFMAKRKQINLREEGSGNLGASNVTLTMGKASGAMVMVFDIAKAFLAFKIAARVFYFCSTAGLIAGISAVVGHIFPFYMHFKGGKGLAAYGGMILALNPRMFVVLLLSGVLLTLLANHSYTLACYAAIVCPIWVAVETKEVLPVVLLICTGTLLIWRHLGNFKSDKAKDTVTFRDFVRETFHKKK